MPFFESDGPEAWFRILFYKLQVFEWSHQEIKAARRQSETRVKLIHAPRAAAPWRGRCFNKALRFKIWEVLHRQGEPSHVFQSRNDTHLFQKKAFALFRFYT